MLIFVGILSNYVLCNRLQYDVLFGLVSCTIYCLISLSNFLWMELKFVIYHPPSVGIEQLQVRTIEGLLAHLLCTM
jgi:hypothetical protein